jgi:DNA repair protein RadC
MNDVTADLTALVAAASPNAPVPLKTARRATRLQSWPASERPRERLQMLGPAALSDAELLALLFGTGTRHESAVELARSMLATVGDLSGLVEHLPPSAPPCARLRGIGPARAARLQAALELARRHYAAVLRERPALHSPDAARRFLVAQLRDRPYEVFCCLYLDNRHRLIAFAELFRGTIDGASVHPREVVREGLARNAAAVIVAHNHPSGVAEPSQADELITRRLRDTLALVDMRLLDHLIVAGPATVSLAERGLL